MVGNAGHHDRGHRSSPFMPLTLPPDWALDAGTGATRFPVRSHGASRIRTIGREEVRMTSGLDSPVTAALDHVVIFYEQD